MKKSEVLKRDLYIERERCVELYNSVVLAGNSVFTQSALIEILIRLKYILHELSRNNNRITWTDDVQTDSKTSDITDLVIKIRNAACHTDSQENYASNSGIKFMFNIARGPNAFKVGNIAVGCEYEDDTAFCYGDKKIYLVRHIKRLLGELPAKIGKLGEQKN